MQRKSTLGFKSCTQAITLKVRPWPSQNLRKEGLPYMAFNASGKTNQVALMHLRLEYLSSKTKVKIKELFDFLTIQ